MAGTANVKAYLAEVPQVKSMIRELAAELERVTADRDAARDLAVRLEGMLGRVEALYHGPHWCLRAADDGMRYFYGGTIRELQTCPTWLLAHYGDAL